jgi:hypothetical protein
VLDTGSASANTAKSMVEFLNQQKNWTLFETSNSQLFFTRFIADCFLPTS